jgi:hypothetical protein
MQNSSQEVVEVALRKLRSYLILFVFRNSLGYHPLIIK